VGELAELDGGAGLPLGEYSGLNGVRVQLKDAYADTVLEVEWKLVEMPLPRLQRVGGQDTAWLYRIGWRDDIRRGDFASRGSRVPGFDNRTWLRPEVAMAFVRLQGLLRPFVEQRWGMEVARLNKLELRPTSTNAQRKPHDLHGFLFGERRQDLEPVRGPLLDLQDGSCFYCGASARAGGVEVDHFLPWARHPDNGLENLVAAHTDCNGAKRDYLAGGSHLERWRTRSRESSARLDGLEREAGWDRGKSMNLAAARALYLRLPAGTRLWASRSRGQEFEVLDPSSIQRLLA